MRFVTLKAGEDVNGLAERLSKAKSKAAVRRTAAALKKANPSLAGRVKKASRDEIVMVPEGLDVVLPRRRATDQSIAQDLVSRSRARMGDIAVELPKQAKRAEEEAEGALSRLDSAELKRAARENPELKARLPELRAAAKERLERAQQATKLQAEALAAMEEDVQELAKLVAGQPGLSALLGELGLGAQKGRGKS
ncbi:MAG: hypothetical protein P8188_15930 [Gemmatimonadota bacterium]|jgi:hypothetical protein